MIVFTCPGCQQQASVQDELAGTTVECRGCRMQVRVPEPVASQVDFSLDDRDREVAGEITRSFDEAITRTFVNVGPSRGLYDFLAPPQEADEIGRLGPFRVLQVLGAGGMGVVYRAEDPRLKRPVALKVMLPILAARASSRKRFVREAKAAAGLDHDHIVPIFQVGEDRGIPFLAMQLLEGESLADRLRRQPALSVLEMLRIGRETALGLAAAHHQGLIHRDVKPANLWLEARPADPFRVKILDFGLARAAADDGHLTQSGAIVGTPAYMAPEQAAGATVDHRADLFSLGCVLYRLSTGSAPFKGKDAVATLVAVAAHDPKPPAEVSTHLPAALSDLVMHLLAKKPEERPQSAQVVVETLADIEETLCARTRRGRSRRRVWVALAGLVLVVGSAGLIVASLRTADLGDVVVADKRPTVEMEVQTAKEIRSSVWGTHVYNTTFSPDGRFYLAGGDDHTLKLYEVSSGNIIKTFVGHDSWVQQAVFTPNGKQILSASRDRTLRLWDVVTGTVVHKFEGHDGGVLGVDLTRDGKWAVSGGMDRTLRLWDVANRKQVGKLDGHTGSCNGVFTPDGKQVVSYSADRTMRLWDVTSRKQERAFAGHTGGLYGAFVLPDGKRALSYSSDRTARIWDLATGAQVSKIELGDKLSSNEEPGGWSDHRGMALTPDGKSILVAYDRPQMLRLMDLETGKEIHRFPLARNPRGLSISPNGRLAACGSFRGFVWLLQLPGTFPIERTPAE